MNGVVELEAAANERVLMVGGLGAFACIAGRFHRTCTFVQGSAAAGLCGFVLEATEQAC